MTRKRLVFVCLALAGVLGRCGARSELSAPPVRPDGGSRLDARSLDGQTPSGVEIAVGDNTACALLIGGAVKCWGSAVAGSLGDGQPSGSDFCHGTNPCSTLPVAVSGMSDTIALTPGCALLSGGTVECWGDDSYGQLGFPPSNAQACSGFEAASFPCSPMPVAVSGIAGATALTSGGGHTCALLAGGTVACWGNNGSGQLGIGNATGPELCQGIACSTKPMPVVGLSGVTAIAAGGSFTCALLGSGTVECWGDNSVGQLGNGSTAGATTPVVVPGLSDGAAVTAGTGHACALRFDGTVVCWGADDAGQLGNGTMGPDVCGTTSCATSPLVVENLPEAATVAAGDLDTCALLSNGTVACWGDNVSGELGDGSRIGPETCAHGVLCSKKPVLVSGLMGVTSIAAGGASACAVVSGATVECWGDNTYGELGVGTSQGPQACSLSCSPSPVAVSGL